MLLARRCQHFSGKPYVSPDVRRNMQWLSKWPPEYARVEIGHNKSQCKQEPWCEAYCIFAVHLNKGNKPIDHHEGEHGWAEIMGPAGRRVSTPGTRKHTSSFRLSCTL